MAPAQSGRRVHEMNPSHVERPVVACLQARSGSHARFRLRHTRSRRVRYTTRFKIGIRDGTGSDVRNDRDGLPDRDNGRHVYAVVCAQSEVGTPRKQEARLDRRAHWGEGNRRVPSSRRRRSGRQRRGRGRSRGAAFARERRRSRARGSLSVWLEYALKVADEESDCGRWALVVRGKGGGNGGLGGQLYAWTLLCDDRRFEPARKLSAADEA